MRPGLAYNFGKPRRRRVDRRCRDRRRRASYQPRWPSLAADNHMTPKWSRIAVALAVTLLRPLGVGAQAQLSRVDGVVVDAANQPVAGAVVTAADPLGAAIRRATSDAA